MAPRRTENRLDSAILGLVHLIQVDVGGVRRDVIGYIRPLSITLSCGQLFTTQYILIG